MKKRMLFLSLTMLTGLGMLLSSAPQLLNLEPKKYDKLTENDHVVTKTTADLATANGWANGTQYTSFKLDDQVTISVDGGGNTGKYYTSGQNYRLYQNESATITAAVSKGYVLSSITYTYDSQNTGTLKDGNTNVASDTAVPCDSQSKTLSVENTSSATNGQVRITKFSVTYKSDGTGPTITTYTVTFDSNGGSAVDPIEVEQGNSIDEAPVTTRPNANNKKYAFLGWYTPLDVLVTFPYTPEADITLTAHWQESDITPRDLLEEKNTAASLYYQYHSTEETDTLNKDFTGRTGTNYGDWTKTTSNNVTFVGISAAGNDAIQLRDSGSSGLISTTTIGRVKKITVVWNSSTAKGRTLDIYGSNTAYTATSNLYNSSTRGTKLGSIVNETSTELTITGDYAYIGIRSNSGALFLNSIVIDWEKPTIDQAAIRYGAVIEKDLYDQLGTVTDYGVILGSWNGIDSTGAQSLKEFYDTYREDDQFEKFKEDAKIRDFNYVVASDPMPTAKEEQLSILGITGPAYLFNVFVDLTAHLTTDIYALSYVTVGGERIFLQEVHYSIKSIAQKYIDKAVDDDLDAGSYGCSLGYLANL